MFLKFLWHPIMILSLIQTDCLKFKFNTISQCLHMFFNINFIHFILQIFSEFLKA